MVLLSQLGPQDDMHPALQTPHPLSRFLPGLGNHSHTTPLMATITRAMIVRALLVVLPVVMSGLGLPRDVGVLRFVFSSIIFVPAFCHVSLVLLSNRLLLHFPSTK